MESGASNGDPFMRRQSNKRNFSTMSASHRDDSPSHLSRDLHYDNEYAARRRRLAADLPHSRRHYPGDGLDFRRPVMSSAAATSAENENGRNTASNAAVIDLTDEDGVQQHFQGSDESQASSTSAAAGAGTRAQRLPRFGRNVIEVESSGEDEDEQDLSHLPGANYLALPLRRTRPQFSGLRRPARPPSPPTDMEDVEFLEARPRPRFRARHGSERPSPAVHYVPRRSATPYPTGLNETIDLTEENDDEIVHLDTRRREGVNNDHPGAIPGAGNRVPADPGYGRIGHIARIIREGGNAIGERLMQRLQGVAVLDGELRAQQQIIDHLHHNHNHRHHVHHQHQAHRRRQAHQHRPNAHARVNGAQAIRIMQDMPGMMDYNMTAFDLGMGGGGNRPPTPTYTPPSPPEKGFTRGPEEEEVVVCPNCGDELAVGDSDVKQEVWVVKACGHAYCGECAQNRSRPAPKKGKGKAPVYEYPTLPPPFKKCVVDGCGKPTSKNSMIMAYLGC